MLYVSRSIQIFISDVDFGYFVRRISICTDQLLSSKIMLMRVQDAQTRCVIVYKVEAVHV